VIEIFPLRDAVLVDLGEESVHEFSRDDLQPWDEMETLRRKAKTSCPKHADGNCDCGKN
jgi:hypothetical protein